MKAWWCNRLPKLAYGDGRYPAVGVTHHIAGIPKVGSWGLHGCSHPWEAISYTGVTTLWHVELVGQIDQNAGLISAASRHYLLGPMDVTAEITYLVRWLNERCGSEEVKDYSKEQMDRLLSICRRKVMPGHDHISLATLSYLACPNVPNAVSCVDLAYRFLGRKPVRDKISHVINTKKELEYARKQQAT